MARFGKRGDLIVYRIIAVELRNPDSPHDVSIWMKDYAAHNNHLGMHRIETPADKLGLLFAGKRYHHRLERKRYFPPNRTIRLSNHRGRNRVANAPPHHLAMGKRVSINSIN